ncbi:hypothetical protein RKD20_009131 [Streptomyces sp. SLBN-8D4]|jgi:hypothetical protein
MCGSPAVKVFGETLMGVAFDLVPRSGIRVERTRQCTRWQDGRRHTWTTHSRRSGIGGGSSGLRLDVLEGG